MSNTVYPSSVRTAARCWLADKPLTVPCILGVPFSNSGGGKGLPFSAGCGHSPISGSVTAQTIAACASGTKASGRKRLNSTARRGVCLTTAAGFGYLLAVPHITKVFMPTRLQLERWAPIFFGILSVSAWWYLDGQIKSFFAKELLAALLSAAAIAAGFLSTAISILLPMSSTPTGQWLRKSGYLPDLYKYLNRAIYSCLFLAGVCVVAFFMLDETGGVPKGFSYLVIFAASYTAAALARIAEVLMNLFERASESDDICG